MKQIIKVKRINDRMLEELIRLGFTVMIVS